MDNFKTNLDSPIGKQGLLSEEKIIAHETLGDPEQNLKRLVLEGAIARYAQPGQFVHVKVNGGNSFDPLLRRPISIAGIDREKNRITLLYRVVGRGTKLLAQAGTGTALSVMGPIGSGFTVPDSGELWLIAGGIGIFPLYALAQAALKNKLTVRLFWGGESGVFLQSAGLAEWESLKGDIQLATMDGSLGRRGLVTDLVADYYAKHCSADPTRPAVQTAACGPQGMLKAIAGLCASLGLPGEVSLEERMGCAVGACLGCVCTLRNEQGKPVRKKVCQDGPVFKGEQVIWDAKY